MSPYPAVDECFFCVAFDPRGYTPPQKKLKAKRGTLLFADGGVHGLRQIDSKSKSAAFGELPGHLPTIQRVFFFLASVYRVNGSDQKWGVSTPFLACLREGIHPAVSTKFGKSPFMVRFSPFLARCGLVCPGLAQKHRRWAIVPARGCFGTTRRLRPTSKRPIAQTRSNVISIRDQHTTELGSVITAYHDETL